MEFKGGVLLIGSLFWQNHKNGDENRQLRKEWRDSRLDMNTAVDVSIPIRYGRFSGAYQKNYETYTMTFDGALSKENYGIAKAIQFKDKNINLDSFINESQYLSNVEGHDGDNHLIKGSPVWCVLGVLINPRLTREKREAILTAWTEELQKNEEGYEHFLTHHNDYSIQANGEFDFSWPQGLDDIDFLLGTATRPQARDNSIPASPEEIAKYIDNRPYFLENQKHGIKTFQDEAVLQCYSKMVKVPA